MNRPVDLPDFSNPPVAEVVLSMQFDDLVGLRHIDLGRLYEVFGKRYPIVSEHTPLSPEFEMFGLPGLPVNPPLRITFGPPVPRLWFQSRDNLSLLQFQANRFVFNWRRMNESTYPRYERLRETYHFEVNELAAAISQLGLPDLCLNQCETTYVNIIPVRDGEADPAARIFNFWNPVASKSLHAVEDASVNVRFLFRDDSGLPFARLTANAFQGFDSERKPVVQFGLTVRGRPDSPRCAEAFRFFDFAREKIVRGFKELTTPQMHQEWGLS